MVLFSFVFLCFQVWVFPLFIEGESINHRVFFFSNYFIPMICLVDILIVSNLFSVTSNAGFIVKCVVGTIKHFKIANIHHFLHILHQVMPAIFLAKKKKKKAFSAPRTLIQNFEEAGNLSRTQGSEIVNLFSKQIRLVKAKRLLYISN